MGGDDAPAMVIDGAEIARQRHPSVKFLIFGDEAQIGPLLADDASTAAALLDDALAALPGPNCIDLLDQRSEALAGWLAERQFVPERPFTRMARGRATAPGSTEQLWLVAGPELG